MRTVELTGIGRVPEWAGKVVDVMMHNRHVYVACENAVFVQLQGDGPFQALAFMPTKPGDVFAPKDEAHGD